MRTFILHLIASVILLSSCSSHKYVNTAEQQSNTTFQLNTNVKGITVEVLSGKNGTGRLLGVSDQYNSTFNLGRLRFYGNYIRVSGKDYDPVVQKIKITPRGKAIKKDLILGVFTYFTPFLIDPFRSDFYKIREDYKSINVNLKYNQVYMYRAFTEIAKSTDVEKFKRYIDTYPQSNYLYLAKDKIDSLDLNTAMLIGTEESLGDFIESHGDAKVNYLSAAQKQKEMLEGARIEYDNIATKTDLNEFKNYLKKYPKFKESSLAVTRSYEIAKSSGLLDKLLEFNRDILVPNQNILNIQEKQRIITGLNNAVDLAIITENMNLLELKDSYVKVWNVAQSIYKSNPHIQNLPKCEKISVELARFILNDLNKQKNATSQTELVKYYNNILVNFSKFGTTDDFLPSCIKRADNVSGNFTLYNQNILTNYLKSNPNNKLLGKLSSLPQGNLESLTFSNGAITYYDVSFNQQKIATYLLHQSEAIIKFYENGSIIKESHFDLSGREIYSYTYINGVNISLKELDDIIARVRKSIGLKNFAESINVIQTALRNNYPKDLSQNMELNELLRLSTENKLKEEEYERKKIADLKDTQAKEARGKFERTLKGTAKQVRCTDLVDDPAAYIGTLIEFTSLYSEQDNIGSYSTQEFNGWNGTEAVKKYFHKALGFYESGSIDPDNLYELYGKQYYVRWIKCWNDGQLRILIEKDAVVPKSLRFDNIVIKGVLMETSIVRDPDGNFLGNRWESPTVVVSKVTRA